MTKAQADKEYDRLQDQAIKLEERILEADNEIPTPGDYEDLREERREYEKEIKRIDREIAKLNEKKKKYDAIASSLEKELKQLEKKMYDLADKYDL